VESFFTEQRIPFVTRDIAVDPTAYREWRQRFGGDIVPLTVFGGGRRVVDGWDLPALRRGVREFVKSSPAAKKGG
jgi:hypothetical protein